MEGAGEIELFIESSPKVGDKRSDEPARSAKRTASDYVDDRNSSAAATSTNLILAKLAHIKETIATTILAEEEMEDARAELRALTECLEKTIDHLILAKERKQVVDQKMIDVVEAILVQQRRNRNVKRKHED